MIEIFNKIKTDETIRAITINYMQNLQLLLIPIQEVFYICQLSVNVFFKNNLKNNNASFFVMKEMKQKGQIKYAHFFRPIPRKISLPSKYFS